jgi:hypothetical protein
MKWIIIDLRTSKALYGVNGKTLLFSTKEIAEELAIQLIEMNESCLIISINLKEL